MTFSDVLSIVSFVAGCIFTLLLTKHRRPLLNFSVYPLLQRKPLPEETVLFDGEPVNGLTRIIFSFWNSGNDAITNEMIVSPLVLTSEGNVRFHKAVLRHSTDESNKFEASIADNRASVQFDFWYLDKKDGAIMEIVCSNVSDNSEFRFSGKIIGCRRFKNSPIEGKYKIAYTIAAYIFLLLTFIAIGLMSTSFLLTNNIFTPTISYCVGFLLSLVLLSVFIDSLLPLRRFFREYVYLMPRKFRQCLKSIREDR